VPAWATWPPSTKAATSAVKPVKKPPEKEDTIF
jgi:hypothetical protein